MGTVINHRVPDRVKPSVRHHDSVTVEET